VKNEIPSKIALQQVHGFGWAKHASIIILKIYFHQVEICFVNLLNRGKITNNAFYKIEILCLYQDLNIQQRFE
jgi:hypothetical protein